MMSLFHIFLVCFDLPKSTKLLLIRNARFLLSYSTGLSDIQSVGLQIAKQTYISFMKERRMKEVIN